MHPSDEEQKQDGNMELTKPQASGCAAGCNCHVGRSGDRKRLILGTAVLLVAATLVARAVIKNQGTSSQPDEAAFPPLALMTNDSQSPANSLATTEATAEGVNRSIASIAELNTVAAANDAVFVYLPGKDGTSDDSSVAAMKSAAKRIGAQGYKIALFTLEAGSRDHEHFSAQMSVPGVLAVVRGRGISTVSGEITETKLIQGFVAASNVANCGPGGCGPAGCN